MTKHTPGPWKVDDSKLNGVATRDYVVVLDGPRGDDGVSLRQHGNIRNGWYTDAVCSCECVDNYQANARLIAAAPDLLEALIAARNIVEKWCHTQGDSQTLFDEYLAPIDTAIAKAKGEA